MPDEIKGRVVLRAAPNKDAAKKIFDLMSKLHEDMPPHELARGIMNPPFVLVEETKISSAHQIVDYFKELGAQVEFVPLTPDEGSPFNNSFDLEIEEPLEPGQRIRRKRFSLRMVWNLALILLMLGAAGFFVRLKYPDLYFSVRHRIVSLFSFEKRVAPGESPSVLVEGKSIQSATASINDVPPENIMATLVNQFRIKPDGRVLAAFDQLASLYPGFGAEGESAFTAGEPVWKEIGVGVSLLRAGKEVFVLEVPDRLDFNGVLGLMESWLQAMEANGAARPALAAQSQSPRLTEVHELLDMADPRYVFQGLMQLEELWRTEEKGPGLLRPAILGYALLLMTTEPDMLQLTDPLAGKALALLALARHLGPDLPMAREEAFLAYALGYTAHARALAEKGFRPAESPEDQAVEAYIQGDAEALSTIVEDNGPVLAEYLLTRTLRLTDREDEAAEAAHALYESSSGSIPGIMELIHSKDFGAAKMLTIIHPTQLMGEVMAGASGKQGLSEAEMQGLAKVYTGAASGGPDISMANYMALLGQWHPLPQHLRKGFLADEALLRDVYTALYGSALWECYAFLNNRFASSQSTLGLARSLQRGDTEGKGKSLATYILARALAGTESKKRGTEVATTLLMDPATPGRLRIAAHEMLSGQQALCEKACRAVAGMDARPRLLLLMGAMFKRIWMVDHAYECYARAMELDPGPDTLRYMCGARGDGQAFVQALRERPNDMGLLMAAGEYFLNQKGTANLEKALTYFDKALRLAPDSMEVLRKKADTLYDMRRYVEAEPLFQRLRDSAEPGTMPYLLYTASVGSVRLKLGDPQGALDLVEPHLDSMQAGILALVAEAYFQLGDAGRAEEVYLRDLDRYPSGDWLRVDVAKFYWLQGRDVEAAAVIAQGRRYQPKGAQWYAKGFVEAMADRDGNGVMAAVGKLSGNGAEFGEIIRLGFELAWAGRPEAGLAIMSLAQPTYPMGQIEAAVSRYRLAREVLGEEQALQKLLSAGGDPRMQGALGMVLFEDGIYEPALTMYENPEGFPPEAREFAWLQKLVAWLALGKQPAELGPLFQTHYAEPKSDRYHVFARHLLGLVPVEAVLKEMTTPRARCEGAYYLGLAHRLKGEYSQAELWYHASRATTEENNGEYHWAMSELMFWTKLGVDHRDPLFSKDVVAGRELDKLSRE